MASDSHVVFKHKLVHLDLKGAPPRIEYLEKVLPLMRKWGATGLLVEYEDCFPYSGDLKVLHTQEPYSTKDIDILQQLAKENNMIIIPLVQTFGHMEFVLKHPEFHHLREVANFPMALCPTNPESLRLVCSMVDQVMAMHTNLQWFHIGCDEVYHLAKCDLCHKQQMEVNLTQEQVFFNHVKSVARHIKEHYPSVTPIVWDDMFRYSEIEVLKESGMGEWVEPMVWHYVTNFMLPADLWERLAAVFPKVWIASAFKGATGPRTSVSSVSYHLENQLTWLSTLQEEQHRFHSLQGCAITGWQRYDHYAVMCELLPQALPSLGICLQALEKGTYSEDLHRSVSDDLGFTSLLPLNPFACQDIPQCSFSGSLIYQLMIEYAFLEASCDRLLRSEGFLTWMNDYNVRRNFTNPVHIEPVFCATSEKLLQLEDFRSKITTALAEVFFMDTVQEWEGTHVLPLLSRVRQWQLTASQQLALSQGDPALISVSDSVESPPPSASDTEVPSTEKLTAEVSAPLKQGESDDCIDVDDG
ncbi:hexosaminidase D-like [Babylonia areolata]|uniref:hexosaminidase D-like n=1 Tax=Babylonia areolata TaxID=304850 RepID=UPI003FD2E0E9